MKQSKNDKLISYINKKDWWRTSLPSLEDINARGLFFASSFKEAEFYGRPLDTSFKVIITSPLVGDNDFIELSLFGEILSENLISTVERFELDKKMKEAALSLGYDSIVLMSKKGYLKYTETFKVPRNLELNILIPQFEKTVFMLKKI
ncbi:MAG: hypothetical protein K1X92_17430 [Bacteroidia bacterium]|nr:hypothetical protein [Bacteroidia bacterium]